MNFLNRVAAPKNAAVSSHLPNSAPPELARVRSVEECIKIFETEAMLNEGGLTEESVATLHSCCAAMREKGLGLEPNLIGRAASQSVANMRRSGRLAIQFGCEDTDLCQIVTKADAERDKRDFARAEDLYYHALALYPMHPVVTVQYAHALKEQGKLPDALVHYVDASIYGAPKSDVEEHAIFIASRLGLKGAVAGILARPYTLQPSTHIRALYLLVCGRDADMKTVLHLMIGCQNFSSLLVELMRGEFFKHANRDLLRLVVETNWSPNRA
jgi:hypothetical protein